ncbi:MAG: T9SS type A sorting domain-containing protein [Bacteroidetes bacterium]|nr:T9SS type A sorting domain-containing protein [Bacteroidota bacterium]
MLKSTLYFTILLFLSIFSNGQTIVDDFNINPNPFQKRAAINYSFINTDTVTINVYNVTGSLVVSPITNSVMTSGVYQDSLIMDAYPDGMYFVQLKLSTRKTIVKKAIKSNTAGIQANYMTLENIRIYPNPVKNKMTVEFAPFNKPSSRIEIFNTLGQCVYSSQNLIEINEIDLSFLTQGIYHLELQGIFEKKYFKIIKE